MSDIVERLNVYGRSEFGQSVPGFMFVEAATEIARLRAELAEAQTIAIDVLKPFADGIEQIVDDEDDEEWAKFRLLIKDYRRAAQAIRALKSPKPQED